MVDATYWNKKIETMPAQELKQHQLKELKGLVKYCYENSSFYKKKLDGAGLKPDSIRSLDDLKKIPFTIKSDLKDNYPYGMVAAKPDEIVEIHASSGTTGNPIVGAYTQNDMAVWQELMARSIYTAGGQTPRHHTHRIRLRVIHRRLRLPLRRPKTRRKNCSCKRRNDSASN